MTRTFQNKHRLEEEWSREDQQAAIQGREQESLFVIAINWIGRRWYRSFFVLIIGLIMIKAVVDRLPDAVFERLHSLFS